MNDHFRFMPEYLINHANVPVHIWTSLLNCGLLSCQYLVRVEDIEKIYGHEEWYRNVFPHSVGEIILGVDFYIL